ncbi:MAG TPA: hypothetical protein VMR62_36415 [Bryobacteraceae bacterium]|nr:hypothetical protein [Bryobacteraceae bacterium]
MKKTLVQYRAILEEAVERELIDKNPARKLTMPSTRKPCGRFLAMEEFDVFVAQLEFRDRLITRMFALRWDDIETGRVRVDESTSCYMREIPTGVRTAADALDRMFSEHGGLVERKPEGPVQ